MPTNEEFRARFKLHSSDRLLGMLENSGDYLPTALAIAEDELRARGMPETSLEEAREAGELSKAQVAALADEKLPDKLKFAYFLGAPLALTPVLFFAISYWSRKGYVRKSKESRQYVLYGLIFWGLVAVLLWQFGLISMPFSNGYTVPGGISA